MTVQESPSRFEGWERAVEGVMRSRFGLRPTRAGREAIQRLRSAFVCDAAATPAPLVTWRAAWVAAGLAAAVAAIGALFWHAPGSWAPQGGAIVPQRTGPAQTAAPAANGENGTTIPPEYQQLVEDYRRALRTAPVDPEAGESTEE